MEGRLVDIDARGFSNLSHAFETDTQTFALWWPCAVDLASGLDTWIQVMDLDVRGGGYG